MCFGGNSAAHDARLQMIQQQQQLQASQVISPSAPMRSDEERRRGVVASIESARGKSGFTATLLSGGGSGDPSYGRPAVTSGQRAVLGG